MYNERYVFVAGVLHDNKQQETQGTQEDSKSTFNSFDTKCQDIATHSAETHHNNMLVAHPVFEKHLNPSGVGIKKGYGKWIKSLDQILDGSKKYRMRAGYIKNRLIKEKWVEEECSSCGYNEIVIGKESVALRLDYEDGDVTNNKLENLRLLCPNCFLSHNGHMPSSERFYK